MDVQDVVLVIIGVLLTLCFAAAVLGFVGEMLLLAGAWLVRRRER